MHKRRRAVIIYTVTVFDLPKGAEGEVVKVNIAGGAGARLKALGVTGGAKVRVLAFSLFRGGVLIGVNGVRLGLRKAAAEQIEVKP